MIFTVQVEERPVGRLIDVNGAEIIPEGANSLVVTIPFPDGWHPAGPGQVHKIAQQAAEAVMVSVIKNYAQPERRLRRGA